MSPRQHADASLGEAALDEAGARDNPTGDATGQLAIGTGSSTSVAGAGVSDVEDVYDQGAGVQTWTLRSGSIGLARQQWDQRWACQV